MAAKGVPRRLIQTRAKNDDFVNGRGRIVLGGLLKGLPKLGFLKEMAALRQPSRLCGILELDEGNGEFLSFGRRLRDLVRLHA
jgi:hypothetical protein